jgi:hypothetical protein
MFGNEAMWSISMDNPPPYTDWPAETHARWIAAANTCGHHLMTAARDYALQRVPATASREACELVQKAALDAIYGMMMLFDGMASTEVGPDYRVEYVLLSRIRSTESDAVLEQIELTPDGDGLCMGYHGWVAGDFGE